MQLQQRHGLFPRILGKGDQARKLANLLLRGRKEYDAEDSSAMQDIMPSTTVDSLIVIDRDVDFATALLTQLTYEGLIDELVGIQHNQAEVDSSIAGGTLQASASQQGPSSSTSLPPTAKQSLKRKIQLDSTDVLFSQLRNTNFAVVGTHLNKIARRLESDYEGGKTARTTSELKDFVNKLPGYQQEHQSLRVHTNLAEDMMKHTRSDIFTRVLEVQQNLVAGSDPSYQHETIEELISRDVPLATILRLLCLESTVAGGLRPRDLDSFKRQILHAYGFQHLLTLDALEKMELLQPRSSAAALLLPAAGAVGATGSKTNYAYLRKELRLIFDDVNEADPNDIAYAFSGYAPLSIRILQCILQKSYLQSLHRTPLPLTPSSTGWQGFEDLLKSAKGPTFNIVQKAGDEKAAKARTQLAGTSGWKTIFVFFLGGVTFAEIAALRFMGKQLETAGERRRLIVLTTSIVSGRSIMDGVMEKKSFAAVEPATK
jgi:vacuolar protein sorting-associated protein 33A